MSLLTKDFWTDALERAVSTAAQAVLLVLGLSQDGLELTRLDFDFALAAQAAVIGFVLALVKAIAASRIGEKNTASLVE